MGPDALQVYLHENRIGYPVGVDAYRDDDPAAHPLPLTLRAYAMQGTPTLILIDRQGRLRRQRFGLVDDLSMGPVIATLLTAQKAGATHLPASLSDTCRVGKERTSPCRSRL